MNKLVSPKIIALAFGVLVVSFAVGFYVFAWQEPTEAPPEGNVPTPLNVGDVAQTKEGDLTIGIAEIKGDSSMSPNLNADKLDDYHAADLLAGAGVSGAGLYGWCECHKVGTTKYMCYDAKAPMWTEVDYSYTVAETLRVGMSCHCPDDYDMVVTGHGDTQTDVMRFYSCYKQ